MAATPKSGLRYPAATAAANVPQDIQNLATDLDWLGGNYATAAARDAANPTPATGDQARVAGVKQTYYGGRWNSVLDDNGQWQTLTPLSGSFTAPVPIQARLFNGWVELRGRARSVTYFPTVLTGLTTGTASTVLQQVSTAYNGDPKVGVMGLDGSFNPVNVLVMVSCRNDGYLRVMSTVANTVQYIDLSNVRFPTT